MDDAYESLVSSINVTDLSEESRDGLLRLAEETKALNTPDALTSQGYYGYQFPWPGNDNYKKGSKNWHEGASLDFLPNGHTAENSEMIAVANGTITNMCHNNDNDHAWIHLSTADGTFKYLHLSWQSVSALGYQLNDKIEQGQILGTLTTNQANGASPCGMSSTGTHLHLTFPFKPFKLDGQYFGETDSGIPASFPSTQCSARPKLNTTNAPMWVIKEGRVINGQRQCSVKGDITNRIGDLYGLGDVKLEDNITVTINTSSDICVNDPNCTPENQNQRTNTKLNIDIRIIS